MSMSRLVSQTKQAVAAFDDCKTMPALIGASHREEMLNGILAEITAEAD